MCLSGLPRSSASSLLSPAPLFKLHGIGGMMGSFLTGIFADQKISALDGATLAPGGINGNGMQVGKQFAEITAISAYSFVVSFLLLLILKYIPGMHLRVSEEAEMMGLDLDQFFDEQIGDWESFQPMDKITHGVIREEQIAGVEEGLSSGSGHSVQREAVNADEKKD
jgi:Amt family ammonium transporter